MKFEDDNDRTGGHLHDWIKMPSSVFHDDFSSAKTKKFSHFYDYLDVKATKSIGIQSSLSLRVHYSTHRNTLKSMYLKSLSTS